MGLRTQYTENEVINYEAPNGWHVGTVVLFLNEVARPVYHPPVGTHTTKQIQTNHLLRQ